jgi:hypothetical protein
MSHYFDWQGNPISREEWARLFEDERHIAEDEIDDVRVSTVWIGLDHRFLDDGPPLIFETMIFGGSLDEYCWRYATEREAREGHARAVELVALGLRVDRP